MSPDRRPDVELRVLTEDFAHFASAMLAASPKESVGLIFAGWSEVGSRLRLLWRDFWPATDGEYIRRASGGAQVSPAFLMPAVKRCRETGEALILAHTHPFSDSPWFSGIDDAGEDQLIPKIAARAPAAPHGALVLGTDGAAVRVWVPGAKAPTAGRLQVVGSLTRESGASAAEFARQDLALGAGSAAQLSHRSAAVIGTGGLGWDMATLLWTHGIGDLTLIDPDMVEDHNLPRLRGATPADVGRPKVEALADVLRRFRPAGRIDAVQLPIEDDDVSRRAGHVDLMLSATDTLRSRLATDRLSRRYLVPLVDAGINIQLADGEVSRIGGRVSVSMPGGPCLSCMQVLTPDAIATEADPLGYRGRGDDDAPSVAGFNAVLAGLAVVEALDLLLRYRSLPQVSRYLTYDGLRGVVREVAIGEANRCGTCRELQGAVYGAPAP